jgi:hypothetical protein
VIENNPNKNLIISMSLKQEFRQSKRRKGKIDPQIHVNSNEGSLKEFKQCFKVFLCFLSIGIPYYKERCVDEEKIINSSDSKSFPKLSQTETPSRTLSDLAGYCSALPEIASIHHRKSQPDIVRHHWTLPEIQILVQWLNS